MKNRLKALLNQARIQYLDFWAYFVLRCRQPKIIGVTGSVGKTTTKELIAAVLMHKSAYNTVGLVWKAHGTMNDNNGLPLAVLGFHDYPKSILQDISWLCALPLRALLLVTLKQYPKVLVLEFGAGYGGDLGRNVVLAPPDIAVITAIGPAHLEIFGSVENIVEVKSALVRSVPRTTGLVVLGSANTYAANMDKYTSARVVKVAGRGRTLSENVAYVIAEHFGLPKELACQAVSERGPINRRLEVKEFASLTMINDSYNANPLSMRLGLDTLSEIAKPINRKVAILGMMGELGKDAPIFHRELAPYARTRADIIIGVGSLALLYEPDKWFATSLECADQLKNILRAGDCILVKGSFSVELKWVVKRIEQIAQASQIDRPEPSA